MVSNCIEASLAYTIVEDRFLIEVVDSKGEESSITNAFKGSPILKKSDVKLFIAFLPVEVAISIAYIPESP